MRKNAPVLVTGAGGFIGRRLVKALAAEGYRVRAMVRSPSKELPPEVQQVYGDLLKPETLGRALEDVEVGYYLVHSMSTSKKKFARLDHRAVDNFIKAATASGLHRAIYLSGLGEKSDKLSPHLASRKAVADAFQQAPFPTTILRAAVIIGAGGASFEIIRALVKRLPLMAVPLWVYTRCQPIAVGDVIRYLLGCLSDDRTAGKTLDIGGPEILTYKDMMERFAAISGDVNLYFPLPFLTPKLSSYGVGLVSPVKASIAMPLIEGLRNEVICKDNSICELIPFERTPFDTAVRLALGEEINELERLGHARSKKAPQNEH